ncbi:hypothetical protein ACVWXB_007474 [Streptomyces sp. TE12347]
MSGPAEGAAGSTVRRMDDHKDEFLLCVRAALAGAGFEPSGPGGDGVHLIRHTRG